jgi:hypothetical protein
MRRRVVYAAIVSLALLAAGLIATFVFIPERPEARNRAGPIELWVAESLVRIGLRCEWTDGVINRNFTIVDVDPASIEVDTDIAYPGN